ncbi:MAG: hypothetical protein IJL02_05900 [Methanobrevibacter sp.]|uniref:hypothetical protein n=1 Tax=Methanobrevibacter sp. TaxID=66852 RepID=UPI0025F01ED8|nr:hypothetical protein [Methanobrevibacter sp.]MBQ6099380.1 hypothetical protein [Methanobrevibacter sp.]
MHEELSFDERFEALGEYYKIESPDKIKSHIRENENIFVFLEEVKPYLEESFLDAEFLLKMNFEPEMDDDYIILMVNVPLMHFRNGARNDLTVMQRKLFPLRRRINVRRECLIMLGFLDV